MSRRQCVTRKVATPFAPLYVHVDFATSGKAVGVRISEPGKFKDTTIGETMAAISDALTAILGEAK